jgi:hypothetical protein
MKGYCATSENVVAVLGTARPGAAAQPTAIVISLRFSM